MNWREAQSPPPATRVRVATPIKGPTAQFLYILIAYVLHAFIRDEANTKLYA
jgi:hypothetical protein